MINLTHYDAYEINPVTWEDPAHTGLMRCGADDPNIVYWSVYGHLPNAGVECIADCFTKEVAEILGEALANNFEVPLHKYYEI